MLNRNFLAGALCVGVALFLTVKPAEALTITGQVTPATAIPLGTAPVNTTTHQVMKVAFSTSTTGVALAFCAGTQANINAKVCGKQLGNANEVGLSSLVIMDAANLNGLLLYVINEVGTVTGHYSLTIE